MAKNTYADVVYHFLYSAPPSIEEYPFISINTSPSEAFQRGVSAAQDKLKKLLEAQGFKP